MYLILFYFNFLSNMLLLHYLPGYQDSAVLNVESKPETSVWPEPSWSEWGVGQTLAHSHNWQVIISNENGLTLLNCVNLAA